MTVEEALEKAISALNAVPNFQLPDRRGMSYDLIPELKRTLDNKEAGQKVTIVVELTIQSNVRESRSTKLMRHTAVDAVRNALMAAENDGFEHELSDSTSIAVHSVASLDAA